MTGPVRILGQASVPSPCTDVCRIDAASGWCEGCMRTLEEIATWGTLDDDDKRAVWQELPRRRAERVAAGGSAVDAGTASTP